MPARAVLWINVAKMGEKDRRRTGKSVMPLVCTRESRYGNELGRHSVDAALHLPFPAH